MRDTSRVGDSSACVSCSVRCVEASDRIRHSPLRAIARKEFIQIQRDRATIYMVFVFPLMMLVLYGFGIRYDVKSVPVTVLDRDETPQTRQYIERFAHSPYCTIKLYAKAYRDF